jgi:predicted PurR-regulated permease PerM
MKPLSLNFKIWKNIFIILLILVLILAFVGFLYNVFIYIGIALFLTILIKPLISRLTRKGIKRNHAIFFSLLFLLTILLSLFYLLVPVIFSEIQSMSREWPKVSERLNEEILIISYDDEGKRNYYSPFLSQEIDPKYIEQLQLLFEKTMTFFFSFTLEFLFLIIIVPILTIIFVREGNNIKKDIYSLIPNKYFEIVVSIIEETFNSVLNFIFAKFIQSLIVGIIVAVGFFILGIKGALILGFIIGLLNIIPYLGPILSVIPTFFISYFFYDLRTTIFALIVIGVAQLVDNLITQPIIIPKIINEHPLIVILVVLIGAKIAGPLGMILAIPIFSIFKIVFQKLYIGLEVIYSREEQIKNN